MCHFSGGIFYIAWAPWGSVIRKNLDSVTCRYKIILEIHLFWIDQGIAKFVLYCLKIHQSRSPLLRALSLITLLLTIMRVMMRLSVVMTLMMLSLERKMLTLGHRHALAPASSQPWLQSDHLECNELTNLNVMYLSSTKSHTETPVITKIRYTVHTAGIDSFSLMVSQNKRRDKISKPFVYLHTPHQDKISKHQANLEILVDEKISYKEYQKISCKLASLSKVVVVVVVVVVVCDISVFL